MTRALAALPLFLAACAAVPQQPADPAAVARIEHACLSSGLWKLAGDGLSTLVPATSLPVQVIELGIDKICADPARFAGDVATAEWVAKNLAAILGRRGA